MKLKVKYQKGDLVSKKITGTIFHYEIISWAGERNGNNYYVVQNTETGYRQLMMEDEFLKL